MRAIRRRIKAKSGGASLDPVWKAAGSLRDTGVN
jgi:hypothetical protein